MSRSARAALAALLLLLSLILPGRAVAADQRLSRMLVFGDSFSDTGDANAGSGGIIVPSPYYQGRASDGPVAVEELAKQLALPAPVASALGGDNFAYFGGTTLGLSFFEQLSGLDTPSLGEQVDSFASAGVALTGDELIVVWGGANDAFANVFGGGTPGLGNDPVTAAGNIGAHITRLAAAGGRTFLVPNLFRVSRIPLVQLDPELQPLTPVFDGWTSAFNAQLRTVLSNLQAELGVTILQFDWNKWADGALARTGELGFSNVTEPACPACAVGVPAADAAASVVAQPANYFFWDAVHPSAAYHKLLGKALADFVKKELRIPETVTLSFSQPLSETSRTYVDPGTLTGVGYADPARANEFLNQIRAERGQEHFAARVVNTGTHSLYGKPLSHRLVQLSYRDGQGGFDWYDWYEERYPDGSTLFGEAVGNLNESGSKIDGVFTIVGGTGRFSGATGSATYTGTFDWFNHLAAGRLVGTITLPAPPTPPSLSIRRGADGVTVSWDSSITGFVLQSCQALSGANWTPVAGVANNSVTIPATDSIQLYRLVQ